MENQIIKKLLEHDKRFDNHDQRFDKLEQRLDNHDQRFDKLEQRLDNHDQRFDKLDKETDNLSIAVINVQEQVTNIKETMATKDDISNITNTLDELVGLAKKKDEELTFMGERVSRVEKDVKLIKPIIGLN